LYNVCASWASQPQKSVTLLPCPGGKTTKSIRTCGGIGGKRKKKKKMKKKKKKKKEEKKEEEKEEEEEEEDEEEEER
jgi:hypothetical protein